MELFPDHAGCAGVHRVGDGAVRLCLAAPVGTVAYRVDHPRPRTVRAYVCEAHAVGFPDPRKLTDHDRADLRRRRTRRSRPGQMPPVLPSTSR